MFALVAVLGLIVAQPAGAGSPTAVLEVFFDRANAILRTVDPFGDLDQPRQAIRELVNEVFDFRGASALALGSAWFSRTPEEQDEFVRLFAVFLERGFVGMIGAKASVADGVKIQYVDESIGVDWAGVATSLLTRSGQELPVDYWFVLRGDRWKVQDVFIDGVSLIANYRSQFNRVLGAYPYSEVIARLGGSRPGAPAMVAASAPDVRTGPAVPAVPAVPTTRQEIYLPPLPSERSTSERVRSLARVLELSRREGAGSSSQNQSAGVYRIQSDVFPSVGAAVPLADRLRSDSATISRGQAGVIVEVRD